MEQNLIFSCDLDKIKEDGKGAGPVFSTCATPGTPAPASGGAATGRTVPS